VSISRGRLLGAAGAIGTAALARAATAASPTASVASANAANSTEPFYGRHQAGILTPQQSHTYFAAFDLTAAKRSDLVALLQTWTDAAALLTAGLPVRPAGGGSYDAKKIVLDSGEAAGLPAARLTLTFGFGPGMFVKDGADRYGLAAARPAAFVDLPRFNGDQLIEGKTGGDLSVQACADDPQVAFHAIRQLARLADGAAQLRWVQAGFRSAESGETPRNLMGFKDGTQTVSNPQHFVWAAEDGPRWMRGGSYLVARRIRIALEHWDRMNVAFQEQTIGRQKVSGAPLGMTHEFDALPLAATDKDGNLIVPETAHVRVANASTNDGAQILRRGYSYNDGVSFVAERWPPWHQGMEYDAGLLFVCYQSDPRTAFIPMFEKMSKIDMLNQFATHTGGGMFVCPGGISQGEYVGQGLFA
jgi:deferrochelatase/peroxidase EfeB